MPESARLTARGGQLSRLRSSASLFSSLLLAGLAIASACSVQAADPISEETIDRLVFARSKELLAGRATPVERIAYPLITGQQPQQSGAAFNTAARRAPGNPPMLLPGQPGSG